MMFQINSLKNKPHLTLFGLYFLVLFLTSSFRHWNFQSTAFDLGIFDQALWQISQGETQVSSLIGRHIISDHGALILYPLSLLYSIVASPYVILLVQSLSLASGILWISSLAQQYKLSSQLTFISACCYACNPVIFNANLFDFHPEVIGVPLIPLLLKFGEQRRYLEFSLVAIIVMSCKEALALTVSGIGLFFMARKEVKLGFITFSSGLTWFLLITQLVMPMVPGGTTGAAFNRYSHLGSSLGEIIVNMLMSPQQIFSGLGVKNISIYIISIFGIYFWVFNRKTAPLLLICLPTFLLNVLSNAEYQTSMRFHYSLPIIPVLGMMAIFTFKERLLPRWLGPKKLLYSLALLFLVPQIRGNTNYPGKYPVDWHDFKSSRSAVEQAISLIPERASIYASSKLIPHLAHRVPLTLIADFNRSIPLWHFDFIIIDKRQYEAAADNYARELIDTLGKDTGFTSLVNSPEVIVFRRNNYGANNSQ